MSTESCCNCGDETENEATALCDACDDDDRFNRRYSHRAQLTRALTAQAWAVACCDLIEVEMPGGELRIIHWETTASRHVAALPAPAEMATQILGDE